MKLQHVNNTYNTYNEPSKLHLGDGTHIKSEEGATQGDPVSMQMYAVSSRKIIDSLDANTVDVAQAWFADDSAAAAKLLNLYSWWKHLNEVGPLYGYFPNAPKTWLILKSPDNLERARELFGPDVKITTDGKRHIGAALGTDEFKHGFIRNKVDNWLKDIEELA